MFDAYLKSALKKEGCPLCRLGQEVKKRYLFRTLWENVNDMSFRLRFLGSDGLCQQHAWQLQATEADHWNGGLGTAILYESLLVAVRRQLANRSDNARHQLFPWWHPARWRPRSSPPNPPGSGNCPVCTIGESTETFYAGELARNLAEPAWQMAFENSEGLCLPHLRLTLDRSNDGVHDWLLAKEDARLQTLQQELSEYTYPPQQRPFSPGGAGPI